MSGIIWGYFLKRNNSIDLGNKMKELIGNYKIDNYNSLSYKNVFFGCGLQYITKESEREVLPYLDKENELIITADAIIDNRDELLKLLDIKNSQVSDYTDSEYIIMAYKKWGKECSKYLIGDYSFVIYDIKEDIIFCAKDHIGKRTFYYYNDDNIFAFSTLCTPLFPIMKGKIEYNERYITDYLAIDGIMSITEAVETIYKDIYQLEAYHTLVLKNNEINLSSYWNPCKDVKKFKYKSEEEYINSFLEIYKEAVNCRLRSNKEVALKLSSGLDSTSVAAIAAPILEKENKRLKSYTSIPMKSFKEEGYKHIRFNERKEVEEVVNFIGNIDANFCSCENISSFSNIDELVEIFESPYKIIENCFWVYELTKIANKDNCNIILTGQFGNSTVSFGDYYTNQKELIRKGRLIKAYKEIKASSKIYNVPRRKLISDIVIRMIPHSYKVKRFNKSNPNFNKYEYSFANKELMNKYDVDKRLQKMGANEFVPDIKGLDEIYKFISNSLTFASIVSFDTKLALATGTINRDPTRDKRIIEFCISLPSDAYVKKGIDRYLIRKSMEGLVPDKIRMNYKEKGLQAADWVERLKYNWDFIYKEIEKSINSEEIKKYIDIDYAKKKLKEIEVLSDDTDIFIIRSFFVILILWRFINNNKIKFPNYF